MHATSITTQKHKPNSDKNRGEVIASYAELSTVYDINRCTTHYCSRSWTSRRRSYPNGILYD